MRVFAYVLGGVVVYYVIGCAVLAAFDGKLEGRLYTWVFGSKEVHRHLPLAIMTGWPILAVVLFRDWRAYQREHAV